jgi:hypothetical protein
MIEYENFKDLFTFFKFKNNPKKHWNDSSRWEMVLILCDIVECRMREGDIKCNYSKFDPSIVVCIV